MRDGSFLNSRYIIRIYTNSFCSYNVKLFSNIIKDSLYIENENSVVHDYINQFIFVPV